MRSFSRRRGREEGGLGFEGEKKKMEVFKIKRQGSRRDGVSGVKSHVARRKGAGRG